MCQTIRVSGCHSLSFMYILDSKPPTQTQKFKTLQKMILSYFHNIMHIVSQLAEPETVKLAMTESAKLIPYVINGRRTVKLYLKVYGFP